MSARRGMQLAAAVLFAVVVAVVGAGCSTASPPRLHSLQGEPLRPAEPRLAWRLAPVAVPAQVDQPQLVVRRADDSIAVLEQERWHAPLQDELRDALAEQLAARLGPAGQPVAAGRAEWRITLDVQRFDSAPGRATLVAQWQVQSTPRRASLACSLHLTQTVADGVPALVVGHRRNLAQLAQALATVLPALDAGQTPACPA